MATYCGECSVWVGSDDVDKYGRRWCAFSRKYEKSNQESTGCKGFSYTGRAVLSEVCNILGLQVDDWFPSFDRVKNDYVVKTNMDWLVQYSSIGPRIASALRNDPQKDITAKEIHDIFLLPAKVLADTGFYEMATRKYVEMIKEMTVRYAIQ